MTMKLIKLEGKSLKGKNRVREHGEMWRVLKQKDGLVFIEPDKQAREVNNESHTLEFRWISINNDKDFTITEVIE